MKSCLWKFWTFHKLIYWRSSSQKTRNDCFDIRKISLYSSAITSSLRNWNYHFFVRPGRIQYSRFFLSNFFFSLEITLSHSISFRTRCLSVLLFNILLKSPCCIIKAGLQRFCKLEIKQISSLSDNQWLAMFEKSSEITIFVNMKNMPFRCSH